jgi:hypothetical protein
MPQRARQGQGRDRGQRGRDDQLDVRQAVLRMLVERIAADKHPSVAQMNMVQELLTPDEVPMFVEVLLDKVRDETYPSLMMLKRLQALAA